ncbi:PorP/SprF family type IX secretion system membrane protein [Bizionia sediminis]|uniref:PorP/SprF family type IX secretion system membrane protein n=1 Tax=Bizionia sediminis TaxID=1737064 RepID=A0ABW5KYR8_9FLAO
MKKVIFYLLVIVSGVVMAQQESTIGFYQNHLNLVNPAYNSVDGNTYFKTGVRSQWSGVKEAPETQVFSFMTPLSDKISIGISVINDQVFIEKQTFVSVDFSYRVQLSNALNLYMGVKAGANSYRVNSAGLSTFNIVQDPSLGDISRMNPNVGVGFYLKHEAYFLSVSTPRLLNTERAKNEDGYATVATDRVHYYVSGGYNFSLSKSLALQPTFMFRYVGGAPVSTDFTAKLVLNDKYQIAANFRTDNTLGGLVQLDIYKGTAIGYLYEYAVNSDLLGRSNGSHEFYLQIRF